MAQNLLGINTLYVCPVYWGCSVHWGDTMSTLGDTMSHWGDTMSTLGDTMSHWGDTMSTSGDIMSTSGNFMSTSGDIMMYVGDIMSTLGMFSTSGFSIYIERLLSPTCIMISPDVLNIPQCTHDIPMYSWYPPDVLNTNYTGRKFIYTLTGIKLYVLQCF